MITIDVYIASSSLTKEYRCDETLPACQVAEEIFAMEGNPRDPDWGRHRRRPILGSAGQNGLLNPDLSLRDSGVKNGDLLLLI